MHKIDEIVYVLITLPDRNLAGWAEGRVVSEEVWEHTVSRGCPDIYKRNSLVRDYGPGALTMLARDL